MKTNKIRITLLSVCIAGCLPLISCSTTTKIVVRATPDAMSNIGVSADSSGRMSFEISDENYIGLLQSTNANNEFIPFALDYGKRPFWESQLFWGASSVACDVAAFVCVIIGLAEEESLAAMIGPAALLLGFPMAMRASQHAYIYDYKYKKYQNANHDLVFTKPDITYLNPPQNGHSTLNNNKNPKHDNTEESTKSIKKIGEKSTKKLSNNTSSLEGTYKGVGCLTKGKDVIEKYQEINVIIKRIDNNIVAVNIVEPNGDQFFVEDSQYDVLKKKNGTMQLTNKNVQSSKITITSSKKLTYIHPRVNIDGEIFQLEIQASKVNQ